MPQLQSEFDIEIAVLTENEPQLLSLKVPAATTIAEALDLAHIPMEAHTLALGGQIVSPETRLNPKDRIDLVPALSVTPEEARQLRKAKKARDAAKAKNH